MSIENQKISLLEEFTNSTNNSPGKGIP